MRRAAVRPCLHLAATLVLLCCCACGGQRFYPVHGRVLVNGKPANGVKITFHPLESKAEGPPVLPTAVVQADGTFSLQTFLVDQRTLKEGAPAGHYQVSCVWYPEDLMKYLGQEILPDKLQGKYANPKSSGLRAEVTAGPTELPPYNLTVDKK
jgi:hypothetical protein